MEGTEIDELIGAAKAQMKKWKKPGHESPPSVKPWQKIMDDRIYPSGSR